MHHQHSDGLKDPHAAKHVGFWKVLFTTWDIKNIPSKYARDLYKNPNLVFCHKHWLKILIGVNVISYIICPYFWVNFLCSVPFVFAKIGFGLLNTVEYRTLGG